MDSGQTVALSVLLSAVVSIAAAKAVAAYHFKVIDRYVREIIDLAKEEMEKVYVSQDTH